MPPNGSGAFPSQQAGWQMMNPKQTKNSRANSAPYLGSLSAQTPLSGLKWLVYDADDSRMPAAHPVLPIVSTPHPALADLLEGDSSLGEGPWTTPEDAAHFARHLFNRTLANWARDVLSLRRRGLDLPGRRTGSPRAITPG